MVDIVAWVVGFGFKACLSCMASKTLVSHEALLFWCYGAFGFKQVQITTNSDMQRLQVMSQRHSSSESPAR